MSLHLPEEHMADIHIIRQDYARALNAYEADPTVENGNALLEVTRRRSRAIRMIHREDNAGVRELSAIFRCSKTAVRTAISEEPE